LGAVVVHRAVLADLSGCSEVRECIFFVFG
jgi:hypothetical protein